LLSFAPIVQHPMPLIWLPWAAPAGTVRCSRCKEVWLARPEDAVVSPWRSRSGRGHDDAAAEWETLARERPRTNRPSRRQPLHSGRLAAQGTAPAVVADWTSAARHEAQDHGTSSIRNAPGVFRDCCGFRHFRPSFSAQTEVSLPQGRARQWRAGLALIIWRNDLVRLLPQDGGLLTGWSGLM